VSVSLLPALIVVTRQANILELPFTTTDVCIDDCFYVNKSLNSVCSSYKPIISLQKMWNKPFNSYGLASTMVMHVPSIFLE